MMHTLTLSIVAAAPIKAGQLVGFDRKPAGLNAPVMGAARADAEIGEAVAVTVVGLVSLQAGAPIAAGDGLISDADGRPIPAGGTANANIFARAFDAAPVTGGRAAVLIR